jgi:hypothetical protein
MFIPNNHLPIDSLAGGQGRPFVLAQGGGIAGDTLTVPYVADVLVETFQVVGHENTVSSLLHTTAV